MLIFWRQNQKSVRNSQRVAGHRGRAFQKSEMIFQGLAAKGTQAPELHKALTLQMIAIPRAPGPMSSQMALLGREAVVPTSVAQMEPPSPSPSKLVT